MTKENKVLQILERIGEAAVSCCVLIFSDFNINEISVWSIWLLVSFMLMVLYEIYWIRYFKSNQTMQDFYSSICKIPVAGATLPVYAFFLLGLYGVNFPLMVSTIILGIGHIGIHRNHQKEVSERKKASIFSYICKGIGFTILGIFLLISTGIVGLKNATYLDCCIHTRNGIDEQSYVMLGGQEQYLHIHGEDVHNPVIVWLHGGPAGPDGYFTYTFSNSQLFQYIQTIDVRDYGLEYQIPAGFISGAKDWITPVKYTEDYVHAVTAPKKNFRLVEECGHQPQNDSPKEFSEILKKMLDDYVK